MRIRAGAVTAGVPVLRFDRGSVVLHPAAAGDAAGAPPLPSFLRWDARIGAWRCAALHYRALVRHLVHGNIAHEDLARDYPELAFPEAHLPAPYPHQQAALEAWSHGKRGVVELPTGAGKTRLALMAMTQVQRGTLVLVPTLELVTQWCRVLSEELGVVPGVVGGGSFELAPVTVCTYASALRHADGFGNRFALAIFDECHHLSAEGYAAIAEVLIAPYRLGLSATVERPDARHRLLDGLIGPMVYRQSITALSGRYLADYHTAVEHVQLTPTERERYTAAREIYRSFRDQAALPTGSSRDWQRFVFAASRSEAGREALRAFHEQKQLAYAPEGKFARCAALLWRHRGQRMLIFTNDNRTAYALSTRFLLPLITHQTRVAERREIMAHFHAGRWPVLVTSKVLNEGVDVPAASVAIVFSGNASVREHVQRLGRILRKDGDKQAVLYELLTQDTGEEGTSRRRRLHDAYR